MAWNKFKSWSESLPRGYRMPRIRIPMPCSIFFFLLEQSSLTAYNRYLTDLQFILLLANIKKKWRPYPRRRVQRLKAKPALKGKVPENIIIGPFESVRMKIQNYLQRTRLSLTIWLPARSRIKRPQESLDLYKSFNTLWYQVMKPRAVGKMGVGESGSRSLRVSDRKRSTLSNVP